MHISLREQWQLNAQFLTRSHAEAIVYLCKMSPQMEPSPPPSSITVAKSLALSPSAHAILSGERGENFAKSSTQVATLVSPQMVIPESCELKLDPMTSIRPNPLGVRFSQTELTLVKAKAKTAGCSTNEYIRASALASDYKPPRNPVLVKALQALNLELTRQGNNLNQIAKHLNGGKASPTEADGMLGIIARSQLQTHKAIRVALSEGKEPQP